MPFINLVDTFSRRIPMDLMTKAYITASACCAVYGERASYLWDYQRRR